MRHALNNDILTIHGVTMTRTRIGPKTIRITAEINGERMMTTCGPEIAVPVSLLLAVAAKNATVCPHCGRGA